jgi:hypothetical protein
MNHEKWINYFTRNQLNRKEPDWAAPFNLPQCIRAPLLKSLEQFRLGEGSGPVTNRRKFRPMPGDAPELRPIVEMWFREEDEHSRLLGCAVHRLGGKHTQKHWCSSSFRTVRHLLGPQFKFQILLLVELVSTAYYRILFARLSDAPIVEMCGLLLRDETIHIAFHRDRLANLGRSSLGLNGALWQAQFWLFGQAAAAMLWITHATCLRSIGSSQKEYFQEASRQLRRFILSLDHLQEAQSERSYHSAAPKAFSNRSPGHFDAGELAEM